MKSRVPPLGLLVQVAAGRVEGNKSESDVVKGTTEALKASCNTFTGGTQMFWDLLDECFSTTGPLHSGAPSHKVKWSVKNNSDSLNIIVE